MGFLDRIFETDMRRFSVKRLMVVVLTLAIGFGLVSWFGELAYMLCGGIILFWIGNVAFMVSDWIDIRPPGERNWLSQTSNAIGLLLVISAQALIILGVCLLIIVGFTRSLI